ncbi:MAG: hypothetical protein LBF72_01515 [Holosporales bacterium]|jgi:hypothetical protein|nr:hypothetical protein [Holosporales bacterium]
MGGWENLGFGMIIMFKTPVLLALLLFFFQLEVVCQSNVSLISLPDRYADNLRRDVIAGVCELVGTLYTWDIFPNSTYTKIQEMNRNCRAGCVSVGEACHFNGELPFFSPMMKLLDPNVPNQVDKMVEQCKFASAYNEDGCTNVDYFANLKGGGKMISEDVRDLILSCCAKKELPVVEQLNAAITSRSLFNHSSLGDCVSYAIALHPGIEPIQKRTAALLLKRLLEAIKRHNFPSPEYRVVLGVTDGRLEKTVFGVYPEASDPGLYGMAAIAREADQDYVFRILKSKGTLFDVKKNKTISDNLKCVEYDGIEGPLDNMTMLQNGQGGWTSVRCE